MAPAIQGTGEGAKVLATRPRGLRQLGAEPCEPAYMWKIVAVLVQVGDLVAHPAASVGRS